MDYTSIKVGQLPTDEISGGNFIPHEVEGLLKKATINDLVAFIGATDAVGFRAVSVPNGGTLPTTNTQEFILVGPGTYNNVGGGSTITVTEELNALVSNGTFWFIGVQISIDAPPGNAVWGQIVGTLSNQTDLKALLDVKADLVAGKVPASQLPSYVDDVVEVANFAALPATGETGKIYVTLDSGFIYRWTGTIYVRIADEAPTWGTIVGTLGDQTDLQTALNLRVPYTGATGNVDLGTHTLSSYNLIVNHTTGSGTAASITKGGNGEALTVVKNSGTGNAASITGGKTLISELNLTTSLADTYIASAATWNAKQNALSGTGFVKISGTTISYDNSTYALDSAVVKLTGDQNIIGTKTFNVTSATDAVLINNTGGRALRILNETSGFGLIINNATSATAVPIAVQKAGASVFTLSDSGNIEASGFLNLGGGLYLQNNAPFVWGSTVSIIGDSSNNSLSLNTNTIPRLYINSTGNVGIGTPSPSEILESVKSQNSDTAIKVTNVNAGGAATAQFFASNGTQTTQFFQLGTSYGTSGVLTANRGGIYNTSSAGIGILAAGTEGIIAFATGGITERMRITSGGNVLIGTTSSTGAINVDSNRSNLVLGALTSNKISFNNGSTTQTGYIYNDSAELSIGYPASGSFNFQRVGVGNVMSITSGGAVLVGTTTVVESSLNTIPSATLNNTYNWFAITDSNYFQRCNNTDGALLNFLRGSSAVGSITVNSTSTFFNTTSDYRLKQDFKNFNGLDLLSKINVYDYEWKSDETRSYGVLAHELQEVIPQAVNGEKDGENMQGVDYSKLVPILVQAIKELKAEIEILKNK